MKKILSLYLLLSLAAQPLFGMEAAPSTQKKAGLIALGISSVSLIAATISYLWLAKTDQKVCWDFEHRVKSELYGKPRTFVKKATNVSIPPLSEITSTLTPHKLHHTKEFLTNDDTNLKVTIQHHITKRCGGLIHCHTFDVAYRNLDLSEYGSAEPQRNPDHQSMRSSEQYSRTLAQVARPKQERLEKKR